MTDAGGRGGDDIERSHHAGRKLVENGRFQARDGGETGMIRRVCGQIDARAPGFVERVSRRVDHAGKSLDALQLAHRRCGQGRLDGRAQALVVDRADEASGQPDGRLLEGHDLEAMATVTARRQAALPHGEAAVNDQCGSMCDGHGRSPSGHYLLLSRWAGVDAAAVFASVLLLGLRNALAAPPAVRLLVISIPEPRFRMSRPTPKPSSQSPLTDRPIWE
ncbi:hypothetical protein [Hansschlegelia zhihuaiae]|uniref:hypothetical protein n=1 Tax=Hansschlegelia zhihuaiae TaxID=405005 RepID=UPI001FE0404B|nr:hypothetical protein [Hansschlegelia zhihuaiae]